MYFFSSSLALEFGAKKFPAFMKPFTLFCCLSVLLKSQSFWGPKYKLNPLTGHLGLIDVSKSFSKSMLRFLLICSIILVPKLSRKLMYQSD